MGTYKEKASDPQSSSAVPLLLLGITSIIIAFFIVVIGYNYSFDVIDNAFQKTQLNKAKQLAIFAEKFDRVKSEREKLEDIESFWRESVSKPDDEYICVVDEKCNLILHTKAPQTLGNNAGENLIVGGNLLNVKCLADLRKTKGDYVGGYISSAGEDQIASFVHIPTEKWILGVHRSKEVLHSEVRSKIRYLLIAFIFVCVVLLPSSVFLLYRAVKKSQKRELESEKRYRSVVQDLPVLICRFNSEGIIEFVNNAYCECFGKSHESLIGNDFYGLILKEDREMVRSKLGLLSVGNPSMTHEHRVVSSDGSVRWQRWTNRALCDKSGELLIIQAFGEDITEEKKTEAQIKDNEVMFRTTFNQSFEFMAIMAPDGKVINLNDMVYKVCGNRPDDIIGKNIWEAWWWNFEDKANINLKSIIRKAAEGIITHDETTFFDKDRALHHVTRTVSPVKDDKERIVYLIIMGQDITERKQSEEAARKEREKLFSVLNLIPGFVYLQARDYSIPFANKRFHDAFGAPAGRPCYEVCHGRNEPCEECPTFRVFETKAPEVWEWTSKDNRTFMIYDEPFVGFENDEEMVLEVAIDITDRKRAEEELDSYREHLEEIVEEKTSDLQRTVNLMAGREIRMKELKGIIKKLEKQLSDAGIKPETEE